MRNKIITVMLVLAAVLVLDTLAVGALPVLTRNLAPANLDTTQRINNDQTYHYGFNVNPNLASVNLDGVAAVGVGDFTPSTGIDFDLVNGLATCIGKNGAGGLLNTAIDNSIWRAQFNKTDTEWTVEVMVNITGGGTELAQGTFGIFHGGPDYGFDFRIKKTGFYTVGVGTGTENNLGWHVFRVARVYNGPGDFEFWIWRDGLLMTPVPIKVSNTTTRNCSYVGDYSGTLGGDWEWEYYSMDPTGAYAPGPGIAALEPGSGAYVVEGSSDTDSYQITIVPDANQLATNLYPTALVQVTVTPDSQVLVNGSSAPIVLDFPVTTDPNLFTQTITIAAVDDSDVESPIHVGVITHTVTSADSRYNGVAVGDVTVDIRDDDGAPGISASKTVAYCKEGGDPNDAYTLVLEAPPAVGQTVTIAVNTDSQITLAAAVIFNRQNWSVPQTMKVAAVNDSIAEVSPHTSTITHTVTSGDARYNGIQSPSVLAYITDNEPQGPTVTQPYVWYKASAGVMAGNAFAANTNTVTAWYDQSGRGKHLRNTPVAGGGFYRTDAADGRPKIRFEGTQYLWSDPATWGTLAQPNTIFVVGSVDNLTAGRYFYDGYVSTARHILDSTGTKWETWAGASLQTRLVEIMNRYVHTQVFNTTTSSHSINSVVAGTGNAGTHSLGGLIVGARYNGANVLIGEVDEILVYDDLLTPAEIAQVEEYLISKWIGKVGIDYTGGSTKVVENLTPTDTYTVSVYGQRTASVDVTVTPTGSKAADIDLGAGAGNPIVLTFAAGTAAETQTVTVTAIDNTTSDGLRQIPVKHTSASSDTNYAGLTIPDMVVLLDDDEAYCGKATSQVYFPGDVNKDCYVNIFDIAQMAAEWLTCTHPFYTQECILP